MRSSPPTLSAARGPGLPRAAHRGSALVTVLMITLGLAMIVASVIGYSLNERRLNYREGMRLEARNAAEAISEYGLAQVRQLMETRSDFSSTRFTSNEGQIYKPDSSFWGGSNVANSGLTAPELIIGLVVPVINNATSTLYYFDPADPNNEFEPLKGRYAFRFDIKIIAKATVNPAVGGAGSPQACYLTQTLSARASPLFSHAVFYNMDLEVLPGAVMNIVGPVHTNGNLYVRSQGTSSATSLNFTSTVTTAKGLYAAYQKQYYMQRAGYLDTTNYTSQVTFMSSSGTVTGLYDSTVPRWRDQAWGTGTTPGNESDASKASFRTWTSQTYQGNLQTALHGIQTYKLVAVGDYVEGSVNDGHKLIEPALSPSDTGYDSEIEAQKYARQCGIQIIVNPSTSDRVGRLADGSTVTIKAGKYRVFAKSGTELVLPGQPDYGTNNALINLSLNLNSPLLGVAPIVSIKPNQMVDMRRSSSNYSINRSASNPYSPRMIDIIEIDMTELRRAVAYTVNSATSVTQYNTTLPTQGTTTTASGWANNIYNAAATPATVALTSSSAITNYSTGMWNGAVYIQSTDADIATRKDSGVRLINARGRTASDTAGSGLTIATNDALYVLGHYNADGTIDTTTGATSSARAYETGETPCSVVCDAFTILSQPIFTATGSGSSTYYSQQSGWNDRLSDHACEYSSSTWVSNWATTQPSSTNTLDGKANDSANYYYNPIYALPITTAIPTAALARSTYSATSSALTRACKFPSSSTELSTAIMTGISPSNVAPYLGYYSGGLHNFPRFLENNSANGASQRTIAIRGSMVSMYDSTAATEPWSLRIYDAPNRLWGFNNLFSEGHFPPLTPRVMSYRRVDFTDINATQYNTMKSSWGL